MWKEMTSHSAANHLLTLSPTPAPPPTQVLVTLNQVRFLHSGINIRFLRPVQSPRISVSDIPSESHDEACLETRHEALLLWVWLMFLRKNHQEM